MCHGNDATCPQFEEHYRAFREDLSAERRGFLKGGLFAAGGLAAVGGTGGLSLVTPAQPTYHYLPANALRGGSVCLNSFEGAVEWIAALVTPPRGFASAG